MTECEPTQDPLTGAWECIHGVNLDCDECRALHDAYEDLMGDWER